MALNDYYKTERLIIQKLKPSDTAFIFELLNSPGWLTFIGDRDIKTQSDAGKYIQRILGGKDIFYWVVTLQAQETTVGVITFIKRSYLDHHDIGFAFLPVFTRLGYAFEATHAVLSDLMQSSEHSTILATTKKDNIASIQLLKKLGFGFTEEITLEKDKLLMFSVNKESLYN